MEGKIRVLKTVLVSIGLFCCVYNHTQAQGGPVYKGALKDNIILDSG